MDGLIAFGVGASSCLILGVCAILASMCVKLKDKEDEQAVPTFKERIKWCGFFLIFIFTFIISVPVGLIVIIVQAIRKNKNKTQKIESEENKSE